MTQGSTETTFRRLGVQRIGSEDDEDDDAKKPRATEITAFKQEGPIVCYTLACLAADHALSPCGKLSDCPTMYI